MYKVALTSTAQPTQIPSINGLASQGELSPHFQFGCVLTKSNNTIAIGAAYNPNVPVDLGVLFDKNFPELSLDFAGNQEINPETHFVAIRLNSTYAAVVVRSALEKCPFSVETISRDGLTQQLQPVHLPNESLIHVPKFAGAIIHLGHQLDDDTELEGFNSAEDLHKTYFNSFPAAVMLTANAFQNHSLVSLKEKVRGIQPPSKPWYLGRRGALALGLGILGLTAWSIPYMGNNSLGQILSKKCLSVSTSNGDNLNLRDNPPMIGNSEIIAVMRQGLMVEKISTEGLPKGWVKVRMPDGRIGVASEEFLKEC